MISSTEPVAAQGQPAWGRPSPASAAPWALRAAATAADAAVRADGGDASAWVVRAASLSGVRHRLAGEGPEDSYGWALGDDRLIAVVADGVGTTEGAAAAAATAVAAAIAAGGTGEDPLAAANEALSGGSGATTLVVAVAGSSGPVRLVRVGDSAAYLLSSGRWLAVWPGAADAGGEEGPLGTATHALPAAKPKVEEAEVELESGQVLVLVTDGVARPIDDGPTTVAPRLAEVLDTPPSPAALAGYLDFSRQGCHDDRTLLAVWRYPSER